MNETIINGAILDEDINSNITPESVVVGLEPNESVTGVIAEETVTAFLESEEITALMENGGSGGGGGGGTDDYNTLGNKPSINNVALIGNKTSEQLGLSPENHTHSYSELTDKPTVPTVNNPTVYYTTTAGDVWMEAFTLNQTEDAHLDLTASAFETIDYAQDNPEMAAWGIFLCIYTKKLPAIYWMAEIDGAFTLPLLFTNWNITQVGDDFQDIFMQADYHLDTASISDDIDALPLDLTFTLTAELTLYGIDSDNIFKLTVRDNLAEKQAISDALESMEEVASNVDDLGDRVSDIEDSYVGDAPSDGNTYARKDGAWEAISAGSSDYSKLTNKPSINNVTLSGNTTLDAVGAAEKNHTHTASDIGAFTPQSYSIVANTYINNSDGREITYSGWDSTDYIELTGDQLKCVWGTSSTWNAFYDEAKRYISSPTVGAGGATVSIPAQAKYVRLSNTSPAMRTLEVYTISSLTGMLDGISNRVKDIEDKESAWDSKAAGNHTHSYNSLTDKPEIPTVNNATISFMVNGDVGPSGFTLNQADDTVVDIPNTAFDFIDNAQTNPLNAANMIIHYFFSGRIPAVLWNLGDCDIPFVNEDMLALFTNWSVIAYEGQPFMLQGECIMDFRAATDPDSLDFLDYRYELTLNLNLGKWKGDEEDGLFTLTYRESPSVPDWALQPSKPSYTASEVGALPDTTSGFMIPITYGATTTTEIGNILSAGNTPYCIYNGNTYYYQDVSYDNYYRFISITPGSSNASDPPIIKRLYKSIATNSGGWGNGTTTLYDTNHKPSWSDIQNKPTIPSAVTESTVSGWGFTKNSGTYIKPAGGIPASDLAESYAKMSDIPAPYDDSALSARVKAVEDTIAAFYADYISALEVL